MKHLVIIVLGLSIIACNKSYNWTLETDSPDGRFTILLQSEEPDYDLTYQVFFNGSEIIGESSLGFILMSDVRLGNSLHLAGTISNLVDQNWRPPYGERNVYPEKYNELIVELAVEKDGEPVLEVHLRAYNEGVAFRYKLLDGEQIVIKDELTEFALEPDAEAWVTEMSQGQISKVKVSEIENRVERPLLIRNSDNKYIAIGEAAQVDFARMKLVSTEEPGLIKASLKGENQDKKLLITPWRFIMAGETAGEILENNYLVLNLNEPNQIVETSWLKPGKVIREVSLTTKGGMACVDFAAKHNLQYVHFDAGWYGHEYSEDADASTITVDPKRSKGPLDLHGIIDYANSKGVDVILYVNRRALEKQLDEILPLYKKWGISGLKYGFVRTGDQEWSSWMHEAVRKAAKYEMVLSIHDDYRPTGYSRTYPNLMTQEGIRGDEESPTNEHTLMTMFTRMIAGAADNTVCYFAPRVDEKMGSHASQLAKSVCLYSPLMWLYWYDRPEDSPRRKGGAGGSETIIKEVPELEFFDALPTIWDDTRVVHSEVGQLGTIARRSGDTWFVGTIVGETDRQVEIPLDFLDQDKEYEAVLYYDNPEVDTETRVGISRMKVNINQAITRNIKANNGMAVRIIPLG